MILNAGEKGLYCGGSLWDVFSWSWWAGGGKVPRADWAVSCLMCLQPLA